MKVLSGLCSILRGAGTAVFEIIAFLITQYRTAQMPEGLPHHKNYLHAISSLLFRRKSGKSEHPQALLTLLNALGKHSFTSVVETTATKE